MPDPSYEEQARAALLDLNNHATNDHAYRANITAYAQVLATLEVAARIKDVELAIQRTEFLRGRKF